MYRQLTAGLDAAALNLLYNVLQIHTAYAKRIWIDAEQHIECSMERAGFIICVKGICFNKFITPLTIYIFIYFTTNQFVCSGCFCYKFILTFKTCQSSWQFICQVVLTKKKIGHEPLWGKKENVTESNQRVIIKSLLPVDI